VKPTVEERLAAMKARLLEWAPSLRGRSYTPEGQVPKPLEDAPAPPLPFQETAEEREPGDDQEGTAP